MQISDYISGAALIISGVAIYFSWIAYKQKQKLASEQKKLASAQKKTELLQKYDERIYKFKRCEELYRDIVIMYKTNKNFHDFVIKHHGRELLDDIYKTVEKIESCLKSVSKSRRFIEGINIAVNPVILEERLPHANRMLLDSQYLLSNSEELTEKIQGTLNKYLKIYEGMSDKMKKKVINGKYPELNGKFPISEP